jgi:hypothetical protein
MRFWHTLDFSIVSHENDDHPATVFRKMPLPWKAAPVAERDHLRCSEIPGTAFSPFDMLLQAGSSRAPAVGAGMPV